MHAVLLLVDFQHDFMPWGALPVAEGDQTVGPANRIQPLFERVVATQDWHPAGHGSFARNHVGREPFQMAELNGLEQILWPDHCVQGSWGAEFVPELDQRRIERVFRKGADPGIDSYSGFYDNGHRKATGLGGYLREQGVTAVYLAGLAEDVCVLYTALDARRLGFETYLIRDATRGVDMNAGDVERAEAQMREAGVHMTESSHLQEKGRV
jgi:nicotinamidase/pyrazinamidase